ncbi:hypothetical protein SAMN05444673_3140 [Bacillus sp. OV166]|nr:hypothetical protein SAMN05444673_3140 [Bacillus sp. OV166]
MDTGYVIKPANIPIFTNEKYRTWEITYKDNKGNQQSFHLDNYEQIDILMFNHLSDLFYKKRFDSFFRIGRGNGGLYLNK